MVNICNEESNCLSINTLHLFDLMDDEYNYIKFAFGYSF